jgi:hypothetical protein
LATDISFEALNFRRGHDLFSVDQELVKFLRPFLIPTVAGALTGRSFLEVLSF